jgi:hypothetical protein
MSDFKKYLEGVGMSPKQYLMEARNNADKRGYDPEVLEFADDEKGVAKLRYEGVEFGRVGYRDFIIWRHLENKGDVPRGEARKRQSSYLARARGIKGKWRDDPNSRNSLAISILWDGSPALSGGKLTAEKIAIAKQIVDHTPEAVMADYQRLMDIDCDDPALPRSRAGLKVVDDATFPARMDTFSKGYNLYTFIEALYRGKLKDKPYIKKLLDYNERMNQKAAHNPVYAALKIKQLYFGSVSAFKPSVAKWIYCKLGAKNILDFSAGWGGRLVGAMVLPDTKYIGIDTNKDLKKGYDKMIKELGVGGRVKMIYTDSAKVDYSKLNYDTVFTSPPYFTLEKYEDMPSYETRDEFNEKFYFPVLRKVFAGLKRGGKLALNIPHTGGGGDMLADAESVLGKPSDRFELPLAKGGKQDKARGRSAGGYKEYVYVWQK